MEEIQHQEIQLFLKFIDPVELVVVDILSLALLPRLIHGPCLAGEEEVEEEELVELVEHRQHLQDLLLHHRQLIAYQ
jgi:hypothetical protein